MIELYNEKAIHTAALTRKVASSVTIARKDNNERTAMS